MAVGIVLLVLFLTFQGPEDTVSLSESFRNWLMKYGYTGDSIAFRSDVHYVEYFGVGLVFVLFCKAMGWKKWIGVIGGCLFGAIDEIIKIYLPTREFDEVDLTKDFLGVCVAFGLVLIFEIIFRKDNEKIHGKCP